jgi:hypothetical protein
MVDVFGIHVQAATHLHPVRLQHGDADIVALAYFAGVLDESRNAVDPFAEVPRDRFGDAGRPGSRMTSAAARRASPT